MLTNLLTIDLETKTHYTKIFFLLSNFVTIFKLNTGLRAQAVIQFNQQDFCFTV